jgi:hypothetical protein
MAMWKKSVFALMLLTAVPAAAQTSFPDVRGTWKGDSESIVGGNANPHHQTGQQQETRFSTQAFTLTIDKQDGRRFSGTFVSARATEPIIGVISQTGTLFIADTDGYTYGTMLGPDKLEICYLQSGASGRVASCTVLTKQQS